MRFEPELDLTRRAVIARADGFPSRADYPYNTVPNKVEHLFQAQLFHDRKQRHARLRLSEAERAKVPLIDYMRPIVADADTGCAIFLTLSPCLTMS